MRQRASVLVQQRQKEEGQWRRSCMRLAKEEQRRAGGAKARRKCRGTQEGQCRERTAGARTKGRCTQARSTTKIRRAPKSGKRPRQANQRTAKYNPAPGNKSSPRNRTERMINARSTARITHTPSLRCRSRISQRQLANHDDSSQITTTVRRLRRRPPVINRW